MMVKAERRASRNSSSDRTDPYTDPYTGPYLPEYGTRNSGSRNGVPPAALLESATLQQDDGVLEPESRAVAAAVYGPYTDPYGIVGREAHHCMESFFFRAHRDYRPRDKGGLC